MAPWWSVFLPNGFCSATFKNLRETTTTYHITQLSIAQNIEILDHFQAKEGGCNNNTTIMWVQKNKNRPNFQHVQLNIIIENKFRIQSAERKDKLKKIGEKELKYPGMEKILSQ